MYPPSSPACAPPAGPPEGGAPRNPSEPLLWHRCRHLQDAQARKQLIELHLPYARVIAATLYAKRLQDDIEFAEYVQLASVGLVESIDRFDPDAGVQFKTFASKRMQGSILNGLERLTEKNQQISVRVQLRKERLASLKAPAQGAEADDPAQNQRTSATKKSQQALFDQLADIGIGLALGILLEDTGMVAPAPEHEPTSAPLTQIAYFQQRELQDLQQLIRNAVHVLPPQEQLVIRYHYLQEVPFEGIAQVLDVTRGRVSQLHRQALQALKRHLSSLQPGGACF